MKAQALFQAGDLDQAIETLSAELRADPTSVQRRTFLFELLCFAGQWERAGRQLEAIAGSSQDAEMGAWLYRAALHAEQQRQESFSAGLVPDAGQQRPAVRGTLNGRAFETLTDADPRIGARLEVFAAGQYTWIPLEHVSQVRMEAPRRLRDLLWAPAVVVPDERFRELELGEVLLPVLSPHSWQHTDNAVRLGRVSDWQEREDGEFLPVGQKLLLVDDEPFPILEIRELLITGPAAS